MKKLSAALLCSSVMIVGCTTTVVSPVDYQVLDLVSMPDVKVVMNDKANLPPAYDNAVRREVDSNTRSRVMDQFADYLETGVDVGDADSELAEVYFSWSVERNLNQNLRGYFEGDTPSDLQLDIENITTPNAATMMLVGEMKSVKYDLELTSETAEYPIVAMTAPVVVQAEKSAGAGGGLLGMALRAGDGQHLSDLHQLIASVSRDVHAIFSGVGVSAPTAKKLMVEIPSTENADG